MAKERGLFKSAEGKHRYIQAYDSVLALWSISFEELEITTRFGCTHVIASGRKDASPLLLLHAANTSASIWFPNVAGLGEHCRTYAIDILGNAGKSISTHPMPSNADCAEWIACLLDVLELGRAHVAGLSYGGWIALNFAMHAPDRVRKAVLISPASPFVPFNKGFILRLLPSTVLPFDRVIEWGLQSLFSKGFRVEPRFMHQLVSAGKYCRLMPAAAPFPRVFKDDELRKVDTRLLLLLGENEVCFDVSAAFNRAQALLPNMQGEILRNVGHALTMEKPAEANARILEFLSDGER